MRESITLSAVVCEWRRVESERRPDIKPRVVAEQDIESGREREGGIDGRRKKMKE